MTKTTIAKLTKGQTYYVATKSGRLVEYRMVVSPMFYDTTSYNVKAQSYTYFPIGMEVFVKD